MSSKRCTKCGETKPLTEFYRKSERKDRHASWCKQCSRIRQSQHYYQEGYKEARRQRAHEHYLLNRDAICERERQRRLLLGHKELRAAWNLKWRREHPDYTQQWRKKYPEAAKATSHRRRALLANAEGSFTAEEWLALLAQYPNCPRCGRPFADTCPATMDHIVPLSRSGSNGIGNIQPLCGSCNSAKHTNATDYRHPI